MCTYGIVSKNLIVITEVSRLSGAESVVGQHDKFEFNVLLNKKPVKIFKNVR